MKQLLWNEKQTGIMRPISDGSRYCISVRQEAASARFEAKLQDEHANFVVRFANFVAMLIRKKGGTLVRSSRAANLRLS